MRNIIFCMLLSLAFYSNVALADDASFGKFTEAYSLYSSGLFEQASDKFEKLVLDIKVEYKTHKKGQMLSEIDSFITESSYEYLGKAYYALNDLSNAKKWFKRMDGFSDGTNAISSYFLGEMFFLENDTKSAAFYWQQGMNRSNFYFKADQRMGFYHASCYFMNLAFIEKKLESLASINQPTYITNNYWGKHVADYLVGKMSPEQLFLLFLDGEFFNTTVLLIDQKTLSNTQETATENYLKMLKSSLNKTSPSYLLARKLLN